MDGPRSGNEAWASASDRRLAGGTRPWLSFPSDSIAKHCHARNRFLPSRAASVAMVPVVLRRGIFHFPLARIAIAP